ncbi:MAG: hypothetical protein ACNA8S_15820 [Deferrisomatales bacterium]
MRQTKREILLEKYREAVRRRLLVERSRREWDEARTDRSRDLSSFERSLISGEHAKFEQYSAAATTEIHAIEEELRVLVEEEEGTPIFAAEGRAREDLEAAAAKVRPRVQEFIGWAVAELGARVEPLFGKMQLVFPVGLGDLSTPPSPETWPTGSFAAAASEFHLRSQEANSFRPGDRVRELLSDLPGAGR